MFICTFHLNSFAAMSLHSPSGADCVSGFTTFMVRRFILPRSDHPTPRLVRAMLGGLQ